jgi:phosphatidylglycerol:prolipoprotein diacylglycerol transferase
MCLTLILKSPGPLLLDYGFLKIRWYGFCTAAAFLLCVYVARAVLERRKFYPKLNISDFDSLSDFALVVIISGLIGARLWFVILNLDYFTQYPLESFQIWLGGQSIQGGLIGAALGTALYEMLQDRSSWFDRYIDKLAIAAVVVPLGQAVGRLGNFFNEEAFGAALDPSKMQTALYISHTGQYHHPTFLYEAIADLFLFALLYYLSAKLADLKLIGSYVLGYSLIRLMIEPLRLDSLYLGAFPAASALSVIGMLIGLALLLRKH